MKAIMPQWLRPEAAPLATRFYAAEGQKEPARRDERIAVLRAGGGTIVAAVRLSPREGHWVLRALRVADTRRGQGLARALMTFLLAGFSAPIWCFSLPHLTPFYQSLGFVPLAPESAPGPIAGPFLAYRRHQPLVLLRYPGAATRVVQEADH